MSKENKLLKQIKNDPELYYAWQANIAMAFQDEYARFKKKHNWLNNSDIHTISNNAAKNFLNLLIS